MTMDKTEIMALADLRSANIARQKEWDAFDQLTLAYRGNELAGEVGEACNVIKKLERERLGIAGSRDTVAHLAEELADVIICTDLIAMQADIDLDAAVIAKFNASSEKVGLKTRLASSDSGVKVRELEADPWVDTRLVRFDDTIVFGRGGFDFDKWESLRWECHTRHGSFAVWKSGRQSWSLYGGKYGALALDRYSSESQAKADVEQLILSYDGEIATPTAPSVAMKVKPLDLGKLVRAKLPCCSIADYEQRIRSALVEVPAVKGEPEPVAWLRHGPDGDAFDICDEDADGAFAVFAAAPPADAGMREALKDAEGIFEQIRLALIKHLDEPVRSAFWKAVEGREKCRAALTAPGATTKSDGGALSSLPAGESEPVVMQASPPSDPLSTRSEVTALTAITKERQRQREVEGTPEPMKAGDAGAMREALELAKPLIDLLAHNCAAGSLEAKRAVDAYADGEAPWSEDEQFEERAKACRARCEIYGGTCGQGGDEDYSYEGECDDCDYDAQEALRKKYALSSTAKPDTAALTAALAEMWRTDFESAPTMEPVALALRDRKLPIAVFRHNAESPWRYLESGREVESDLVATHFMPLFVSPTREDYRVVKVRQTIEVTHL